MSSINSEKNNLVRMIPAMTTNRVQWPLSWPHSLPPFSSSPPLASLIPNCLPTFFFSNFNSSCSLSHHLSLCFSISAPVTPPAFALPVPVFLSPGNPTLSCDNKLVILSSLSRTLSWTWKETHTHMIHTRTQKQAKTNVQSHTVITTRNHIYLTSQRCAL